MINSGLESFIEEFIEGKTEDVIEFEFFIGEETISVHSVEEGSTFETSSGVFFFKGEELTGSFSKFSEEEVNSPDLTFVFKTVFADKLKFVVDSFLFEGSSGSFES